MTAKGAISAVAGPSPAPQHPTVARMAAGLPSAPHSCPGDIRAPPGLAALGEGATPAWHSPFQPVPAFLVSSCEALCLKQTKPGARTDKYFIDSTA